MHPIFGRLLAECSAPSLDAVAPSEFLFKLHVNGDDHSALQFVATDFKCHTFHAVKSREQLEDLRDDIGIGGAWSEFIDYIIESVKSGDVKLIMEGASYAKLIAQKAKGMPRISISLSKLVDGAAGEAMSKISLELYKEFKDVQNLLLEEQEHKCQLTQAVAAQQEKNANLQKQLEMVMFSRNHKSQKINDRGNTDSTSLTVSQDSPGKRASYNPSSTKGTNRVVPVHRRSKVRGAILDDTEDDA